MRSTERRCTTILFLGFLFAQIGFTQYTPIQATQRAWLGRKRTTSNRVIMRINELHRKYFGRGYCWSDASISCRMQAPVFIVQFSDVRDRNTGSVHVCSLEKTGNMHVLAIS